MKKLILAALLISFISACASTSLSNKDRLVIIDKYLKDNNITQVKKITSFRFHGWQSIDNHQLIISTSANKRFLITLMNDCHGLNFTHQIIIQPHTSSTLQTRFDYIQVPDLIHFKCFIKSINPLNNKQANELLSLINNSEGVIKESE
jgi:hypothetical protein